MSDAGEGAESNVAMDEANAEGSGTLVKKTETDGDGGTVTQTATAAGGKGKSPGKVEDLGVKDPKSEIEQAIQELRRTKQELETVKLEISKKEQRHNYQPLHVLNKPAVVALASRPHPPASVATHDNSPTQAHMHDYCDQFTLWTECGSPISSDAHVIFLERLNTEKTLLRQVVAHFKETLHDNPHHYHTQHQGDHLHGLIHQGVDFVFHGPAGSRSTHHGLRIHAEQALLVMAHAHNQLDLFERILRDSTDDDLMKGAGYALHRQAFLSQECLERVLHKAADRGMVAQNVERASDEKRDAQGMEKRDAKTDEEPDEEMDEKTDERTDEQAKEKAAALAVLLGGQVGTGLEQHAAAEGSNTGGAVNANTGGDQKASGSGVLSGVPPPPDTGGNDSASKTAAHAHEDPGAAFENVEKPSEPRVLQEEPAEEDAQKHSAPKTTAPAVAAETGNAVNSEPRVVRIPTQENAVSNDTAPPARRTIRQKLKVWARHPFRKTFKEPVFKVWRKFNPKPSSQHGPPPVQRPALPPALPPASSSVQLGQATPVKGLAGTPETGSQDSVDMVEQKAPGPSAVQKMKAKAAAQKTGEDYASAVQDDAGHHLFRAHRVVSAYLEGLETLDAMKEIKSVLASVVRKTPRTPSKSENVDERDLSAYSGILTGICLAGVMRFFKDELQRTERNRDTLEYGLNVLGAALGAIPMAGPALNAVVTMLAKPVSWRVFEMRDMSEQVFRLGASIEDAALRVEDKRFMAREFNMQLEKTMRYCGFAY